MTTVEVASVDLVNPGQYEVKARYYLTANTFTSVGWKAKITSLDNPPNRLPTPTALNQVTFNPPGQPDPWLVSGIQRLSKGKWKIEVIMTWTPNGGGVMTLLSTNSITVDVP
ncbi:MAG: hypothetical protein QM703_13095 [Gemmatales bacterium]